MKRVNTVQEVPQKENLPKEVPVEVEAPQTELQSAQEPSLPVMPPMTPSPMTPSNMRLTPRGATSAPLTRHFPEVRAGQCAYCGTIDPHQPGHLQYKLCPHYRGMDLKCIYCSPNRDQAETVKQSTIKVFENPYRPGELVTHCGSFDCVKKFEEAFAR